MSIASRPEWAHVMSKGAELAHLTYVGDRVLTRGVVSDLRTYKILVRIYVSN